MRALDVGIVIDLDAARGSFQGEHIGDAFQQLGLGAVLCHTAAQLFARIGQGALHDVALFAALGHGDLDLLLGAGTECFGQQNAAGQFLAGQDQARRGALVVELADKTFQHFGQRQVAVVTREVGPVAPILSGAEEEHLYASLASFCMSSEQVGLVEGGGINALRGLDVAHRLQPVAQFRRRLEIHGVGRRRHFGFQFVLHRLALALQEAFGLLRQFVIAGQVDAVHAGCAATLDLEQQAGAGPAFEHRIRT